MTNVATSPTAGVENRFTGAVVVKAHELAGEDRVKVTLVAVNERGQEILGDVDPVGVVAVVRAVTVLTSWITAREDLPIGRVFTLELRRPDWRP